MNQDQVKTGQRVICRAGGKSVKGTVRKVDMNTAPCFRVLVSLDDNGIVWTGADKLTEVKEE